MEDNQPTKLKYIGVWILAAIISQVLQRIVDFLIAEALISDVSDLTTYFIVGSVAYVLISVGVLILIYNFFNTLNMKKVFTYIVVLGGLGTLASLGQTAEIYRDLNVDLTVYFLSSIIGFIVAVFSIRSYYIGKPERWH